MIRCPHSRGGEPESGEALATLRTLSPTRVGVNRFVREAGAGRICCPHSRGGEPDSWDNLYTVVELSPLAWG